MKPNFTTTPCSSDPFGFCAPVSSKFKPPSATSKRFVITGSPEQTSNNSWTAGCRILTARCEPVHRPDKTVHPERLGTRAEEKK